MTDGWRAIELLRPPKVYRQLAVDLLDMHAIGYRRQRRGRMDNVIRALSKNSRLTTCQYQERSDAIAMHHKMHHTTPKIRELRAACG